MSNGLENIMDGNWNAWADIVIKTWKQKQIALKVGQYRTRRKNISHEPLFLSFQKHVNSMTNGQVQKIEFLFKEYGIFVDMGVGRETALGNTGNLDKYAHTDSFGKKNIRRKRKEWYNKVWYREVMSLREYMAKKIGNEAANTIIFGLQTNIAGGIGSAKLDTKYSRYRERNIAKKLIST
jgi:hypothetical protein